MNKRIIFSIYFLIISSFLMAQSGKVMDNLSMESKILKMERKYAIYLPPDYETSQRSYPVLYLLHGSGGNQTDWIQFGEVHNIADESIRSGAATPMVIVMPHADTGRRGYWNDVKNEWQYEDYFFQEFMPFIEKTYRIKADKRYRAISGFSLGGEGSYIYALHHPELFSSACPLSGSIGPKSIEKLSTFMPWRGVEGITDSEKEAYFKRYNVLTLIENLPDDQKKAVRWYIDCGDEDPLSEGNCLVHIAMRKKEILHEFRIRDGYHNWTYWRASLPKVLEFVSMSFHQY